MRLLITWTESKDYKNSDNVTMQECLEKGGEDKTMQECVCVCGGGGVMKGKTTQE